ncbi:hypothetical protein EMELA_v1c00360 [Mesoplasma melaleucae]|uniref:Metallo-beta-lactamase domain-containing protein n=2 Tax=Mesoplasma melaleucae TaxID=81459 RepID=A0A2K8NWP8_9MOLU|nr:hypothetical protein EMELA_v1c00360 [Mesoplasma melaleucae]
MKSIGVKQIDTIFITHQHTDYYNAVNALVKAFPVKTVNAPLMGATGLRIELSSSITTVNTKFEKTYKSQGYTFTNITA